MKNYLTERLVLIKVSIINTFQRDYAYAFNNWGNILSATVYMIVTVLFINILYSNVKTIAGYDKDEMLFFIFIAQLIFIFTWMFSIRNIQDLIAEVNSGEIDLILSKPVPSLFYVSTKTIDIFSITRDFFIGVLAIIISIQWSNLNLNLYNVCLGFMIFVFGFLISHVVHFVAALPVFWLGESSSILDLVLSFDFEFIQQIPFEGFNFSKTFQSVFITFIPLLISVGVSVSVMLGKLPGIPFLILTAIVCVIFLRVKVFAWKLALKNYTSASS